MSISLGIEQLYDKGKQYVEDGFKGASKAVKIAKAAKYVADEFTHVPDIVGTLLEVSKPLKIIKGALACKKLYKNAHKLFTKENPVDKAYAAWGIVKASKKITDGVETVFKVFIDFRFIPEAALCWTAVTGYLFMPVAYVHTAVSVYHLGKASLLMNDFRANTKVSKQERDEEVRVEAMKRAITYIKGQHKALKKVKVISQECPLKDRTRSILARLQSDNAAVREASFQEGKMIISKLKDRLEARITADAIDATVDTVALTVSTVALFCPVAAAPVLIIDLACAVVGTANYFYARTIPRGDFLENEKPTLYAHTFKEVRRTGSKFTGFVHSLL